MNSKNNQKLVVKTITAINRPHDAHRFPGLVAAGDSLIETDDPMLMSGAVSNSEVGNARPFRTQFGTYLGYQMRGRRKQKIPSHLFGKVNLGDAFSYFDTQILKLPAVGGSLHIQPFCSAFQRLLIDACYSCTADAQIILKVDEPFGGSQLIELYCPEMDETSKTRGLRWKPSIQSSILLNIPFSSDVRFRLNASSDAKQRIGFPGLGVMLRVIEESSTETLVKPLNITVFTCINNLVCVGYKPGSMLETFSPLPGYLKFWPAKRPAIVAEKQMDLIDFSSPGVVGDSDVQPPPKVVQDETPEVAPVKDDQPVESVIKVSSSPKGKKTAKPNAGQIANRWILHSDYLIDATVLSLSWKNIKIIPNSLPGGGDAISRQFRRNVWCSGSEELGFMTGLRVRIVTNKPPHVAGTIEFSSSANGGTQRTYCELGSAVEFEVMFDVHRIIDESSGRSITNRSLNSPWLRTTDSSCTFGYRLVSFNRSSELSGIKFQVFLSSGSINVQVPIRPKALPTNSAVGVFQRLAQSVGYTPVEFQMDKLGPSPVQGLEPGEIECGDADDEALDHDSFWVRMPDIMATPGKPVMVDLNLARVTDQFGNDSTNNSITEKFARHANVIPAAMGPYGPVVGEYKLVPRFPTGITANLAHVSLPGDMNLETAEYVFGLSSILGIAGSALASIGGPLITGAINTVGNLAKPLLGEGIVDGVMNIASGLMGGLGQAPSTATQTSHSIGGDIPISRDREYLKMIDSTEQEDPAFGKLLVQLLDVMTNSLDDPSKQSFPIQLYTRLKGKVERNLIDRTVNFSPKHNNPLYLNIRDAVVLSQQLLERGDDESFFKVYHQLNLARDPQGDLSVSTIDVNPDNIPEIPASVKNAYAAFAGLTRQTGNVLPQ
uniref:Uncharacterized protein n=1 Tax=Warroolaba Creek virus 1 TaxID=2714906 RepID=A0A6G7M5M6_9VIRU|nr:hypothetical protein [Warroolaba Creek virus 1]